MNLSSAVHAHDFAGDECSLIRSQKRDEFSDFLRAALTRTDGVIDPDLVKELAHLLFRIAEGNGWTKDALSFNTLVASWPEVLEVARSMTKPAAAINRAAPSLKMSHWSNWRAEHPPHRLPP